jgi:hypothetical protein
VIGVARVSEMGLREELEKEGIETDVAELINETALESLPDAENVLYRAGTKLRTNGKEPFTWARYPQK